MINMMPLKGKRIFYVEDDLKNLTLTRAILENAGAYVASESWVRGQTVIKIKSYLPLDLILLDLMFPKNVSGYDVFDAIREEPFLSHVPVVAVSASDPSLEIPKARARGFAGFIGKPIKLRLFPQQIAACINGEPIWLAD
jgi:two-component system, cell cycle response regulator DivK